MTHYWEWAEAVIASPDRASRESAAILTGGGPVILDADLRATREAAGVPRGEIGREQAAGIARFLERARQGQVESLLIVSRPSVIRRIAAELGEALPSGRPWPAEMVLLTERADGQWHLGRRSSDPPALESALEREGLSGDPDERPPDCRAGRLELAPAPRPRVRKVSGQSTARVPSRETASPGVGSHGR